MKAKVKLDKRRKKNDGTYPLVISIGFKRATALLPLDIFLTEDMWDEKSGKVVNTPQALYYNTSIRGRLAAVETALVELQFGGYLKEVTKVGEFKKILQRYLNDPDSVDDVEPSREDSVQVVFSNFIKSRKAPRTQEICQTTLDKLNTFVSGELLTFEDIDKRWLDHFERNLRISGLSTNSIAIHMRNLRACINYAIDYDITTNYPFRRYKIKSEETRKRSIPVEELREFFNAPVPPDQELHLDMFKLIFFLIGINMVDLSRLQYVKHGRINYKRSKTGKLYSIKLEPETQAILDKYPGKDHLVSVFDTYASHRTYTQHLNKALKKIGYTKIGKHGSRTFQPLQPEISAYWARHTWATIAASLDIPKETISHALGHGSRTVTDIYIDFDIRKVDEANRKVIDWVLYEKK